MIPLLLALPSLISAASSLLGGIDHPAAKAASEALTGVTTAIDNKEITPDQVDAANSHLEAMAQIAAQAQSDEQTQNAQTQRVEIASEDAYVRRMRPTFGYAMALSWTVQMLAISGTMLFNPGLAVSLIASVGQLTGLWGLGLSVLGIYTYGRTQEKRAALNVGVSPSVSTSIGTAIGATWNSLAGKIISR